MKKRILTIGVSVVLAAAAIVLAVRFLLCPSEEFRLRRLYAELETQLSCPASAGAVARAGKARQARRFLFEPCHVDAPPCCAAVLSRDEAVKLLLRIYSGGGEIQVRFSELEFLSLEKDRAVIRCTLQCIGQRPSGKFNEVRILQCTLRKVCGEWLFAEIHTEEVIQK